MRVLLFVLMIGLFSSCLGSKKLIKNERTKTSVTKTEEKKDSVTTTEKSKAINDKVSLSVPKVNTEDKEFNKRCDAIITELLKQLNSQKSSGDNSYKLYYDLNKRLLQFETKIGETINSQTNVSSENSTNSSVEDKIDTYIYKKVVAMPWYLWVVVYFLFLDKIVARLLSNFIPRLQNKNSVLGIFKKP